MTGLWEETAEKRDKRALLSTRPVEVLQGQLPRGFQIWDRCGGNGLGLREELTDGQVIGHLHPALGSTRGVCERASEFRSVFVSLPFITPLRKRFRPVLPDSYSPCEFHYSACAVRVFMSRGPGESQSLS